MRALGGGKLCGDKPVHFAFLDEAGTGGIDKEPHLVVGGVIVRDILWKKVEGALFNLARDVQIVEREQPIIFHAADIFHGSGYFDKDHFTRDQREYILAALCAIPAKFKLPVILKAVDRAEMDKDESMAGKGQRERTVKTQGIASLACAITVEKYMRENVKEKNEIATLVYENTDHAEREIREIHNIFRHRMLDASTFGPEFKKYLPLKKSEATTHAERRYSAPVRIAEAATV